MIRSGIYNIFILYNAQLTKQAVTNPKRKLNLDLLNLNKKFIIPISNNINIDIRLKKIQVFLIMQKLAK